MSPAGLLAELAPDVVEAVAAVVEAAKRDPEVARTLAADRVEARRWRRIRKAARDLAEFDRAQEPMRSRFLRSSMALEVGFAERLDAQIAERRRPYLLALAAVLPADIVERVERLEAALTVAGDEAAP